MTELFTLIAIEGTTQRWELPEIDEGDSPLKEVILEPASSLEPYISYDESNREIIFAGDDESEYLAG